MKSTSGCLEPFRSNNEQEMTVEKARQKCLHAVFGDFQKIIFVITKLRLLISDLFDIQSNRRSTIVHQINAFKKTDPILNIK